jgi:hypothetical protein
MLFAPINILLVKFEKFAGVFPVPTVNGTELPFTYAVTEFDDGLTTRAKWVHEFTGITPPAVAPRSILESLDVRDKNKEPLAL